MKCPLCTTTELMMTDRQGIEIDYCPQCRGVWLDRGELDKIIERSGEQPDSRPHQAPAPLQQPLQPYYQPQGQHYNQGQGYQQGHGQKPYRKKSFLEELFD